jgi:hypothetical protein
MRKIGHAWGGYASLPAGERLAIEEDDLAGERDAGDGLQNGHDVLDGLLAVDLPKCMKNGWGGAVR